ncbi:unnamed protein product [Colletotrichum noveboracense]|uniref:MATE efflux family protein n=1 Tax=Colletotrichum noveboracense TaxID=2664923 RepID=A0A9W4WS54_9PEZI|nr:unnamed protein product [Colletotrichum noveboracense]
MARLSFAGSVATLSEYAAFEILCFSTSYLSTRHLAAQSILTTTSIVVWHVPFSISVFSSNRVGHLVGAGLVGAARRAAVVHGVACLAAGCLSGAVTFLFRRESPRMFTDDADVLNICAETIAAIAEAMLCGTNGMLRGLGRQSFAAYVVSGVNYLAVVPLSIWLMLGSPHWGLLGFWVGLPVGFWIIVCVQAVYMRAIRWEKCVDEGVVSTES